MKTISPFPFKTFLLFAFFICFANNSIAQEAFEKTYGDPVATDEGMIIEVAPDGGFIMLGRTANYGAGLYDFYLIKTNMNGDTLWTKTYGNENSDLALELMVIGDFYYLCGDTENFDSKEKNVLVVKTDLSGNVIWSKNFDHGGLEQLYDVSTTSNGGLLMTGVSYDQTDHLFMFEIDGDGDLIWNEVWQGPELHLGLGIQETMDGGFVLSTWEDGILKAYKYDTNREVDWQRELVTNANLFIRVVLDMITLKDGGILFTYGGPTGPFMLKVNLAGDPVWEVMSSSFSFDPFRVIENMNQEISVITENSNSSIPAFIQYDQNGVLLYEAGEGINMSVNDLVDIGNDEFVLVGTTRDSDRDEDIRFVKINSVASNNIIWNYTLGAKKVSGAEAGHQVIQTNDDGFILVGIKYFENWNQDIYVIKTNPSGQVQWDGHYGTSDFDDSYSITETSDGGYIILGYSLGLDNFKARVLVIKIDENGVEEWEQSWIYDYSRAFLGQITQVADGGYILGTTIGSSSSDAGMFIAKLDNMGNQEWTKTFMGEGRAEGFAVLETSDGNYAIGGTNRTSGGYYIVKVDLQGNTLWEEIYGGGEFFRLIKLIELDNQNIVGTGLGYNFTSGSFEPRVLTVSMNGDSLSSFTYASSDGEYWLYDSATYPDHSHVFFTSDILISNSTVSRDVNFIRLVKTDEFGNVQWERDYQEGNNPYQQGGNPFLYKGTICSDNGIAVAGVVENEGSQDIYLLKTNVDGLLDLEVVLRPSNQLKLSPNPGNNELNLQLENDQLGELTVEIFDRLGRQVATRSFYKGSTYFQESINLGFLDSDVYFVRLIVDAGQSFVRKWVKG